MSHTYAHVGGQLVKLVEESVEDLETEEATLAVELDDKQNVVNDLAQRKAQVEAESAELEAAAEAKSLELDEVKSALDGAEADLAKSVASKQSLATAIELANAESDDSESEEVGDDSDGEPGESAEDISDRISLAVAED